MYSRKGIMPVALNSTKLVPSGGAHQQRKADGQHQDAGQRFDHRPDVAAGLAAIAGGHLAQHQRHHGARCRPAGSRPGAALRQARGGVRGVGQIGAGGRQGGILELVQAAGIM
jgi:hypothetical protein